MYAHVNGTELFCEVVGEGPPLLCLHGGLGFDHSYLRPGLDPLSERRQLVYLDLRGNGRSAEPTEWAGVTDRTWVDDVEALRRELHLGDIVLFGHSYGGALAQEYALRHPEHLRGLVLCATAAAYDDGEGAFARARARATPEQEAALLETFSTPLPDDDTFASRVRTVLPLYFHDAEAHGMAAFDSVRFRAAAFKRAALDCLPAFRTLERLRGITAPTLIVTGADDWFTPPVQAERLARGIPHAEVAVLEKSGHYPFIEEPELFRAALGDWLERHPATHG